MTSPAAVEKGLRSIGPDQRDVGDRLRAEQIVESVLFPTKVIAKGYDSFVVVTDDGKVHKGVMVSQSAAEIVLVDPEKSAQPESAEPTLTRCGSRVRPCRMAWRTNSRTVRIFLT